MKTKSILIPAGLMICTLTLCGCGGKKSDGHEGHDMADTTAHAKSSSAYAESGAPQFSVDAAFQQQLAGVFNGYLSMKDAFVASDPSAVKSAAVIASSALGKVDMKLLDGAAHHDWMNYLEGLRGSLQAIQASNDIEVQRTAFSELSNQMYKTIKAFGLGGVNAYYDFCPMAFNNTGAFWLSSDDKILNPYFGDKMLTCGLVKEKLK